MSARAESLVCRPVGLLAHFALCLSLYGCVSIAMYAGSLDSHIRPPAAATDSLVCR